MKPFDLEAAMRGEPIVTRDGRKAKFIGYVPEAVGTEKVVALVAGVIDTYQENGRFSYTVLTADDLFMAPQPMLSINGHEFPEPSREPLKEGQEYWLVDPTDRAGVSHGQWDGEECEFRWLDRGLIQLTEEGAKAQFKAIFAAIGGEL